MKYSEAKKQIEALSNKYSIDMEGNYFHVKYKIYEIAYVYPDERYKVCIWSKKIFSKLTFSNKLYMILSELAMTPLDERVEGKKHYVKIQDGNLGYLNINSLTGKMMIDSADEIGDIKTKFTDKGIEQLKQRDDIPLDWDKVRFEEANWPGLHC
ncbi:hypothetical protein IMAU80009_03442 [Lactiplantibacillus plantarum]|nr:hypothetical protein [Lactiplantibacillus plantarum]